MVVGSSSDKPPRSGKPCGLQGDLWNSVVMHQRRKGELRSCFAVCYYPILCRLVYLGSWDYGAREDSTLTELTSFSMKGGFLNGRSTGLGICHLFAW